MTTIITTTLFWQFVILNFVNVLINTARSLTTVKGGKWIAALMNALCYGYYTVIIVITATYEIPLALKIIAVAIVNFIGVFTIKFCEEKIQKEKLWIFNATAKVNAEKFADLIYMLSVANIKFVYNVFLALNQFLCCEPSLLAMAQLTFGTYITLFFPLLIAFIISS